MEYRIENELLEVTVSTRGAQLSSIVRKCDNVEHLWQSDPNVWAFQAPILFPYCGRLPGGKLMAKGGVYEPKTPHGFARFREHTLVKQRENSITFELVACDETLALWPYKFRLLTTYTLCVTCNNEGLASILANAATPEEAASIEAMLTGLANANSWEQIFSCINRLFYLIQCMSVAVLCWYACTQKDIKVLLFAILGHSLVRLPYGLYTAGLLTDFRAEELVTYVLSLGFGLLAVQYYNRLEGGKFKFKGDRLAVRRRR